MAWRKYLEECYYLGKWWEGEAQDAFNVWDTAYATGSYNGEEFERFMALLSRRPNLAATHPFRSHNGFDSTSLFNFIDAVTDIRGTYVPRGPNGPVLPPTQSFGLSLTSGVRVIQLGDSVLCMEQHNKGKGNRTNNLGKKGRIDPCKPMQHALRNRSGGQDD